MTKTFAKAKFGYQWVWTDVAEMAWGAERKKGTPLPVYLHKVCPREWVNRMYVKQAPIEMERR